MSGMGIERWLVVAYGAPVTGETRAEFDVQIAASCELRAVGNALTGDAEGMFLAVKRTRVVGVRPGWSCFEAVPLPALDGAERADLQAAAATMGLELAGPPGWYLVGRVS